MKTPHAKKGLLILMSGLPGSGKSTVSRQIAQALSDFPVVILQADFIRKQLFPQPIYSDEENITVHSTIRQRALDNVVAGKVVVYDATNTQAQHRQWVFDDAERLGFVSTIVVVEADENRIKERLDRREREQTSISDANFDIYLHIQESAEKVEGPHFAITTDETYDDAFPQLVAQLRALIPKNETQ